ncbi:unnamed protein product [Callosobruchus maculatus]|uniref:Uncharacterized protein n=1 Tax=Callosobruchus maculatus TaxID=64391 RepID=A0A653C0T7_CALMS|nr:unnamed protein product [Callosobruchus maculatus]
MTQYNSVLNTHNRMLDLVLSDINCKVEKDDLPLVPEDNYHPSLSIALKVSDFKRYRFETNLNSKCYNFKKGNYLELYNEFLRTNWDSLMEIGDLYVPGK